MDVYIDGKLKMGDGSALQRLDPGLGHRIDRNLLGVCPQNPKAGLKHPFLGIFVNSGSCRSDLNTFV